VNSNGPELGPAGFPSTLPSSPYPPSHPRTSRRLKTPDSEPEKVHAAFATPAMGDLHRYQPPPAYGGSDNLPMHPQASTPQHAPNSAGPIPGPLQPGSMGRPGPISSNTAPGPLPTLPQISTQMQQTPQSTRSTGLNHSYSRSSPTGLEASKYKPFPNTPEGSNYTPNPSQIPRTPQLSSYSPLGLADIRPPGTDLGLASPSLFPSEANVPYPTNSNHVAPWPLYALDWCKWPPRSHSGHAGKVAVGSYLEDNHNYVWNWIHSASSINTDGARFKYSMLAERNPVLTTYLARLGSNSSKLQKHHIHILSREYYGSLPHPPNKPRTF